MNRYVVVPFIFSLLVLSGCGGSGSSSADAESSRTDVESSNLEEVSSGAPSAIDSVDEIEIPDDIVIVDNDSETSGSEGEDFGIGDVYTDIWHSHSSFFAKWGISPNRTIRFTVSIDIDDELGEDNIDELYIQNEDMNFISYFVGGDDEIAQDLCYVELLDIYECVFYSGSSLNRVNLKNWKVVAENKQGVVKEKDFSFRLPTNETDEDLAFIYSDSYTGETNGGTLGLEAMTREDNGVAFELDIATQSYRIEFEATDINAHLYSLVFYDLNTGEKIAVADTYSPTLQDNPIIIGHKTSFNLPWSEIDFKDGKSVNDIIGMHVVLYDEPEDWFIPELQWSNYGAISEFVLLTL